MVDVFGEVDERVRSDQYSSLARRALPWALAAGALILIVVLGVWGVQRYRQHNAEQASQAYADAQQALGRGDAATAFAKFAAVAKSGPPVYRTLALMQEAAVRLNAGDRRQAVQMLDDAAKVAPNQVLGDLARLKSAFALLDTASLTDLEARLTPLADAKRPFHALAREAIAMAKLRSGKVADSRADFSILVTSLEAPDDVRERARAAITLIDDGSAASVQPTLKAALVLPPPPATPGQLSSEAGAAQ